MRIRVQIIAEDLQHRMKNSKEVIIEIPSHMLHEGVDPAAQVRGTAEWALQHAAHAVKGALQPQQAAYPGAPMGASPAPGQGHRGHGAPQGYGAETPFQGTGAPGPGTAAPIDPKRTPTTADEIIAQSMHGLQAAITEDKHRGGGFLDPNGNPSSGIGAIGWGPHRRK